MNQTVLPEGTSRYELHVSVHLHTHPAASRRDRSVHTGYGSVIHMKSDHFYYIVEKFKLYQYYGQHYDDAWTMNVQLYGTQGSNSLSIVQLLPSEHIIAYNNPFCKVFVDIPTYYLAEQIMKEIEATALLFV